MCSFLIARSPLPGSSTTRRRLRTDALLDRLKADGALVPGLWRLELGNALTKRNDEIVSPPHKLPRILISWIACRL